VHATRSTTLPGPGQRAPARRSAALIAILGTLTAVAPLACDMYVPGFPELGRSLHASTTAVELSMTAFLAGLVVGQPLIGPLSDALGRRRLLIPGTALFALLSFACAFAPGAPELIAARFLEGVAGAAGIVLARAVITDRFHGPELPRYFSLLSIVFGVAPVAAPVMGGAILSLSSWRVIFIVLGVIGALLAASVLRVPESLPPERRNRDGMASTFRAMGGLLRRREFTGTTLTLGFIGAALFAYISGSSFVFEDVYRTSTTEYSLIYASNGASMLLAAALFGRLSRRLRLGTLLGTGVALAALGTVALAALTVTTGGSVAVTWICLFVALFGVGTVIPAAMTLGQEQGRAASGAASGLLGSIEFLMGAIASPLVGAFGTGSAAPMAVVMLVAVACAAAALLLLARPWQQQTPAHSRESR
jgi:DHA1 family bicyclomycin/chloramphenicol resistance-like MFS transporter